MEEEVKIEIAIVPWYSITQSPFNTSPALVYAVRKLNSKPE